MKALYATKNQRAAIKAEAVKQVYEARDKLFNDMDAVILWTLHERFGFGKERLRRFFDGFVEEYTALQKHYELGKDTPFVCKEKLKQIGVDVEEWETEIKEG
ncbi:MAG: hypothetical protein J1E34_08870 [Oscillospiraceae bacterium]|nr:hypothetical protein [Oscillospiraceae bacterium]